MKGMEKISEAILDKVRADAKNILKEAEEKAREEKEKAEKQQEARLLEEKGKLIEEAKSEAGRIAARTSLETRQKLLATKTEVIDEVVSKVKVILNNALSDESLSLNLIKEAIDIINTDKVIVYASPKDISTIQKLVKREKELASRIVEVKEFDCLGGVIVEDINGKIKIDNTYETRLEMLLPRLLPEIGEELFKGS